MNQLEDLLSALDKIQGLPAVALVCFTCIAVGYALRFIKAFPNNGIPVVVILWGALAMLFLADPRATTMSPRVWTSRNIAVGLIIGLISWLIHKLALSRLEDWIAGMRPNQGKDTTFFDKKDVDTMPESSKTPEKP
jgi:hypothetical protein